MLNETGSVSSPALRSFVGEDSTAVTGEVCRKLTESGWTKFPHPSNLPCFLRGTGDRERVLIEENGDLVLQHQKTNEKKWDEFIRITDLNTVRISADGTVSQ